MRRMITMSVLMMWVGCGASNPTATDTGSPATDTATPPADTVTSSDAPTDPLAPNDECADGTAVCHANANCADIREGYTCTCQAGFEGDGQDCTPICGDGMLYGDEACDDSNTVGGDGCRADCLGLELCGDGLLDSAAGEECDDGNVLMGDGCDDRCENEPVEGPCGNGQLNIGEECDDGNATNGDGCDSCEVTLSDAWTCDPVLFKDGQGCECGCGQVDPDCPDATVESCDYCGGQGTCNPNDPSCQQINVDNNASCI